MRGLDYTAEQTKDYFFVKIRPIKTLVFLPPWSFLPYIFQVKGFASFKTDHFHPAAPSP
jgi:hypothetical protein